MFESKNYISYKPIKTNVTSLDLLKIESSMHLKESKVILKF